MNRGGTVKRFVAALILSLACLLAPATAHAAEVTNKGLYISPLQEFISLSAGEQKSATFTVGNHTNSPITVNLAVKQFSVTDYAYDYRFSEPNKWLTLSTTTVQLKPNESTSVPYTLAIPVDTAAGGQYYTLFASAQLGNGGLSSTVQATTLVYVTVKGRLLQTSDLVHGSIQHVVFGNQINYRIDAQNIGNVHYFAYFSGKLKGLSTRTAPGTSHLLLPGPIREVKGTIPAPLLPGLYHATYGYRTDAGKTSNLSGWVLYLPPWFLALLAIIALAIIQIRQRRKAKKPTDEAEEKSSKT